MKEEEFIKQHAGNRNPFSTPEGYFDTFTSRLMQRLPQQPAQPAQDTKPATILPLRQRLARPFRYAAAAALAGICLAAGTYVLTRDNTTAPTTTANNFSQTEANEYIDEAMDCGIINNNQIAYYLTEAY